MSKRLETLILLLGSDHTGEAAAAAAALVRELKKTGKDLHWLKDRLTDREVPLGIPSESDWLRVDLQAARATIIQLRTSLTKVKAERDDLQSQKLELQRQLQTLQDHWQKQRAPSDDTVWRTPDCPSWYEMTVWSFDYAMKHDVAISGPESSLLLRLLEYGKENLSAPIDYPDQARLEQLYERLRRVASAHGDL